MKRTIVLAVVITALFSALLILCAKNPTNSSHDDENGQTKNDYFFITFPRPNGRVNIDSTLDILWIASNKVVDSPNVNITLYRDSIPAAIVASSAPNNGAFSYTLHKAGSGTRYRIKISTFPDTTKFDFSGYFDIYSRYSGAITITDPTADGRMMIDSSYTLRWETTKFPGPRLRLELYCDTNHVLNIVEGMATTLNQYPWSSVTTPLGTNSRYRIKAISENDESIFGFSDYFRIVSIYNGGFVLKAPSASTEWASGYNYSILWDTTGSPGPDVNLQLYMGQTLVSTIAQNVPDNGKFTWATKYGMSTSSDYLIKICSAADAGLFAFSNPFTITGIDPDSYEPDNKRSSDHKLTFDKEEERTITWNDTDWVNFSADSGSDYLILSESQKLFQINCALFLDTGSTLVATKASLTTGNLAWLWSCAKSGKYYGRIVSEVADNSGAYTFKVSRFNPSSLVSFEAPSASEKINAGTTFTVRWTPDSLIFGSQTQLYLYKGTNQIAALSSKPLPNSGSFEWTIPSGFISGKDYSLRLANAIDTRLYGQGPAFSIAGMTPDTFEIDDIRSKASELAMGVSQNHSITYNDTDWVRFSASTGLQYIIILKNADSLQTAFTMFKDTSAQSLFTEEASEKGSLSTIWKCPASAVYSGRITAKTGGSFGNYTVTVLPFDSLKSITFTAPTSSSVFVTGTSTTITWIPDSIILGDSVSISVFKGSSRVSELTARYPSGDPNFTWNISDSLKSGNDYKIKIADANRPAFCGFSPKFVISNVAPDEFEADGTPQNASHVVIDSVQKHTITYGDTDYIWFSADSGSQYILSANGADQFRISGALQSTSSTTPDLTFSSSSKGQSNTVWTCNKSGKYYVRITAYSFSITGAYSFRVLKFNPETIVSFIAPVTGTTWSADSTCTIRWNSDIDLLGDNVALYLYSGTNKLLVLTSSTSNNGSYAWKIPSGFASGSNYRIQLVGVGNVSIYGYSSNFTISGMNGDEYEPDNSLNQAHLFTLENTELHNITYNDTDWIKFTADSGSQYIVSVIGTDSFKISGALQTASSTTPELSFSSNTGGKIITIWTCAKSGAYYAKLTANSSGKTGAYSLNVKKFDLETFVSFISPVSGTTWSVDSSITIQWNPDIDLLGDNVSLYLCSGTNWLNILNIIVVSTANKGIYTCKISSSYGFASDTGYRIMLIPGGNTSIHAFSPGFTLNGMDRDEYETDNSADEAHEYKLGTTELHNITYLDGDYIKFAADNGARYKVSVNGTNAFKTTIGFYYENNFTNGDSYTANSSGSISATWQCSKDGMVYARIGPYESTSIGAYSLTITIFDSTKSVNFISPKADTSIVASDGIPVKWTPDSSFLGDYVHITLYKGNTAIFVESMVNNSGNKIFGLPSGTVLSGNDYRLKIENRMDSKSYGYSPWFSISGINAVPDEYEIDSTSDVAKPIALNEEQQHNLILNDKDWMVFQMEAGAQYIIMGNLLNGKEFSGQMHYGSPSVNSGSILFPSTGSQNFRKLIGSSSGGPCYIEIYPSSSNLYTTYSIKVIRYDATNSFRITNPTAGMVFTSGEVDTVRWVYDTIVGHDIRLDIYNGNSFVTQHRVLNNGIYYWDGNGLTSGSNYRIQLWSEYDSAINAWSPVFTVKGVDADSYEPDNSPDQASVFTIGSVQQHNVTYNDTDWIKIPVQMGYKYLFEITNYQYLYSVVTFTDSAGINKHSNIFSRYVDNHDTIMYLWTCNTSGTYYLQIYPESSSETGNYSVKVTRHDTSEAAVVSEPTAGTVWTAGTPATVIWSPDTDLFGSLIEIALSKGGKSVYWENNVPNTGSYSWTIPSYLENGTDYSLYIHRSHLISFSGRSSQKFTVKGGLDADSYEPDNVASKAALISIGDIQRHSLLPNDTDWVRFQADSGTTYIIEDSTTSTHLEFDIANSNSTWSSIAQFDPVNGLNSNQWLCTKTGIYYVRITTFFKVNVGTGTPGIYSIRITTQ